MSLYDITVKDANGLDVSMKDYEGKVLLIVNTATGCGLTPQYEGLQDLYDQYREQGFEILDFPCNQFATRHREPMMRSKVSVKPVLESPLRFFIKLMSMAIMLIRCLPT